MRVGKTQYIVLPWAHPRFENQMRRHVLRLDTLSSNVWEIPGIWYTLRYSLVRTKNEIDYFTAAARTEMQFHRPLSWRVKADETSDLL